LVKIATDTKTIGPVGDHMEVRDTGGARAVVCAGCRHEFGPADQDPKLGAVMREIPISELSPLNGYSPTDQIAVRQFFCPGCGVMIGASVARRGDPIVLDTRLTP
jgi:acetone carboxylase gamma subunit